MNYIFRLSYNKIYGIGPRYNVPSPLACLSRAPRSFFFSCARHFQASGTQAREPPDLRICRVEETGYILSNSIKNGAFNLSGILWTGR